MIFTYKPVSKRRFTRLEDIPEGVPLRVIEWYEGTPPRAVRGDIWKYPAEYRSNCPSLYFEPADPYTAEDLCIFGSDTFILELW